ncbi:unnamed protein product, partial [Psylliodes chrysocephalus]
MKLILIIVIVFIELIINVRALDNKSLVAVHLIFRHGDRCPEMNNLYKSSPYYNESYFKPSGFGQLTNKGKLTAYNLGKDIRTKYTGFLDETYNINLIDARSSDFNRTKASLQAMLAGLFPPTKELTWLPGFNWQPIATTYVERNSDKELFCFGCPSWDVNKDRYLASEEGKSVFGKYDSLLDFLSNKTEEKYEILNAYYLNFGFEILEELGYPLPDWASDVYPYPLKNLTLDYYGSITATRNLRQMAGGYLLKHILHDTDQKINGSYPDKKMYLWCGHENNIASVLQILKVWTIDDVASYGSYIAFELHYVNGVFGFQILYKNRNEPVVVKLPDCDEFCPIDTFKNLVGADIPIDDSICRGAKSSASNLEVSINYILVLIISVYHVFCEQ